MPISREEFESKLDRPSFFILQFLRENVDAAFTAEEIREALVEFGAELDEEGARRALEDLLRRDRIEASARGSELYYSYRRWLGLRRR